MITRRQVLKTIALSSGALALGSESILGQGAPPPAPAAEPEGVFKLPPLGYDYDALEPVIDAETMKIHHDKHHAAYVSKLNQALAKAPEFEKQPLEELLGHLELLPESIRNDVRNQGGGHANHTLFWQLLKKNENGQPSGQLAAALNKNFGSVGKFQEQFNEAAMKLFGSGWVWLVWKEKKLSIQTTANQDTPLSTGATPILAIDLWEHAYYLKHQNRRADYVQSFQKVLHWDWISERFSKLA